MVTTFYYYRDPFQYNVLVEAMVVVAGEGRTRPRAELGGVGTYMLVVSPSKWIFVPITEASTFVFSYFRNTFSGAFVSATLINPESDSLCSIRFLDNDLPQFSILLADCCNSTQITSH